MTDLAPTYNLFHPPPLGLPPEASFGPYDVLSVAPDPTPGSFRGTIEEYVDGHVGTYDPVHGYADAPYDFVGKYGGATHEIWFHDIRQGHVDPETHVSEGLTSISFFGTFITSGDLIVAMSGTFHRLQFRWVGLPGRGGRWEAIDTSSGPWVAAMPPDLGWGG